MSSPPAPPTPLPHAESRWRCPTWAHREPIPDGPELRDVPQNPWPVLFLGAKVIEDEDTVPECGAPPGRGTGSGSGWDPGSGRGPLQRNPSNPNEACRFVSNAVPPLVSWFFFF